MKSISTIIVTTKMADIAAMKLIHQEKLSDVITITDRENNSIDRVIPTIALQPGMPAATEIIKLGWKRKRNESLRAENSSKRK